MSIFRQTSLRDMDPEPGVLVRFWSLDHPTKTSVNWGPSDWPKLVFASEGILYLEAESQVTVLPANRALWVPAGSSHRMNALGPSKVRTLYFHPFTDLTLPARPLHVRPLMRELILETCEIGPLQGGNPVHRSIAELLVHEISIAGALPTALDLPAEPTARRAALLLLNDPVTWGRLTALAQEVGCARRTLERRFLRETGLSLGHWARQARLLRSVEILSAGMTVDEAAFRAGYNGPSAFIHAFRTHLGVTPGDWIRLTR